MKPQHDSFSFLKYNFQEDQGSDEIKGIFCNSPFFLQSMY